MTQLGCRNADGIALVTALLVILLMSALAAAFVAVTASELMIAANFRESLEALHAADAAAERALADLSLIADWNEVLTGNVRSTFVDGPSFGSRSAAGTTIDLSQVVNLANCGRPTPCSDAEMDLVTVERPWGVNNPRWRLYAHGALATVLPGAAANSPYYAVVLIGDDASESDGNPLRDELPPAPGAGVVAMRAEVFGPRDTRKVVEVSVGRAAFGLRVASWRQRR